MPSHSFPKQIGHGCASQRDFTGHVCVLAYSGRLFVATFCATENAVAGGGGDDNTLIILLIIEPEHASPTA